MKYRYSVTYYRDDSFRRQYRLTVTAANADEARELVAIRDPKFSHTRRSPKRGAAVVA